MKILFFTDHFMPEPSAPAAHVFERCKIWVKSGHEVTVICAAPNFPTGKVYEGYKNAVRTVEMVEGIRVVRVITYITQNNRFFRRILDYVSYMVSSFIGALFESKPDVIISTSPHIFVPVAASLYAWLRKVPHVFEVRDLWPESIAATTGMKKDFKYRLVDKMVLRLYHSAEKIICLSPSFVKELVGRGVSRDKIEVVINGANLDLFSPRPKDAEVISKLKLEGKFVVGYLGTIGLAHGLENVIKAAQILRNDNIHFLFVGVGADLEKLKQMVSDNQNSNVTFVGRVEKKCMPQYWSICDASLIHLKNENVFHTVIPSKIFESMAMGIPIVYVGPRGVGSSIVENHTAGIWVKPDSPEDLAEAVISLRNKKDAYYQYKTNSAKAASNYSRERQASKTMEVLTEAYGM